MNYNKQLAKIGIISALIIFTTGFISVSTKSGYQTFKDEFKEYLLSENLTSNIGFSEDRNGVYSATHHDYTKKEIGKIYTGDEQYIGYADNSVTISAYPKDKTYTIYNRTAFDDATQSPNSQNLSTQYVKFIEAIVDGLTTNFQSNFVKTVDENNTITIDASIAKAEIPAVINEGLNLMLAQSANNNNDNKNVLAAFEKNMDYSIGLKNNFANRLTFGYYKSGYISNIDIHSQYSENKDLNAWAIVTFVMTKQDDTTETINCKYDLTVTDVGTTVVERPDLSDYTIPPPDKAMPADDIPAVN